jgi:3-keto-5-aminohexanoate cleavage enzyme
VRVGLEDAPLGSNRSNQEWVEAAVAAIDTAGGQLATAEDIRALLHAAEMGDG